MVRIPAHEAGRKALVKTRRLDARADRIDCPRAPRDPEGHAAAIRRVGAEALIVLEPCADGEADGPLKRGDTLYIDGSVIARAWHIERGAVHRLPLQRPSHRDHVACRKRDVEPGVQPGARDPVRAAVGEGRGVGRAVRSDSILTVVAMPIGGEAALHTAREAVPPDQPRPTA